MKSAAVLILVCLVGLAIYLIFGRLPKSTGAQPQTSPPSISQPLSSFAGDYESAKAEKDRRVVLVFSSEWCPHCVRLESHLGDSNLDGLLFCFIDTGERPDLEKKYKIRKLPTSIMLERGLEKSRKVGFLKEDYDKWLSSNK